MYSIQPTDSFREEGWDSEWGHRSAEDALYEATGLTPNDAFESKSDAEEFFGLGGGLNDKDYCIKKVRSQDIAIPRLVDPVVHIIDGKGNPVKELHLKVDVKKHGHQI